MKVGVLTQSSSNAASALGASEGSNISEVNAWTEAFETFGHDPGLAGRKVSLDFTTYNNESDDLNTQFAGACAHFTEDNHDAVVVDSEFFNDTYDSCLTQHNTPHVSASDTAGDITSESSYPARFAPGALSIDDRERAEFITAKDEGFITSSSKVGIIMESCPGTVRAYNRTVKPLLKQLGITAIVETADCVTGLSQVGTESAQASNDVLKFESAGVTVVRAISTYEAALLLVFADDAQEQGYHPKYLASSSAAATVLAENLNVAQYSNIEGAGWLSPIDTGVDSSTTAGRRCLATARKSGTSLGDYAGQYLFYNICQAVQQLAAALSESHGQSSASALSAGFLSLKASIAGAGNLGGAVSFADGHHYGVGATRAFSYLTSCSCYRYEGPLRKTD